MVEKYLYLYAISIIILFITTKHNNIISKYLNINILYYNKVKKLKLKMPTKSTIFLPLILTLATVMLYNFSVGSNTNESHAFTN